MKLVNLIPLKEIDFRNQDQFDNYIKQHELRPSTKVTIAGKVTTAGQAAKNSKSVKGASVFGKDKGASVFAKAGGASAKSDKVNTNWMDDLDSIDTSDIKGKADPSADSWKHDDVFGATFKDPETGKPITVGDAYDREDDSPAYQKAFAYVSQFDPDGEAIMGTQAYDDLNKKTKTSTKSKPFDADRDADDFEKALPKGFSWYEGGTLDGVTSFGDENGNNVFISDPAVYDDKGNYAVSGYNDDDMTNTNYKSFKDKEEAIAYAKQLATKLSGSTKLSEMIPTKIKK